MQDTRKNVLVELLFIKFVIRFESRSLSTVLVLQKCVLIPTVSNRKFIRLSYNIS